jgi:hypothetical protein
MKKYLLLASTIAFSCPAVADTWTTTQQPIVFLPTGNDVIGDGTTTQGGIAPAYENGSAPVEAADIADNFTAGTYLTTANTRCTYPTGNAAGAVNCVTAASEAKGRFMCNWGFTGTFDPIVYPGQANAGHRHMFSGNLAITKDSNYSFLRQNGESTCSGNKQNRTGYWAPELEETLLTGYKAARKFAFQIIYYTTNPASLAPKTTRIPRNFRYIGGYDPNDPNNTKLETPRATANTAAGWSRYSIPAGYGNGTSSGTGFTGWTCLASDKATPVNGSNVNSPVAGSSTQPYLRNAAGQTTLTCPTNGALMAEVHAPICWDGHNLGSGNGATNSTGRLHVSYQLQDNNTGQLVCPHNWYMFPEFLAKYVWYLTGTEDVGKLSLSSDTMNYGAPDPSSRSPCRKVSSNYCRGETFHFDWFGAWSYGTTATPGAMIKWMNHCTGIKITDNLGTLNGDPAECDTSTIDSSNALQISGTTTDGHAFGNPGVTYTGVARYDIVTPGATGNAHMHHGIIPPM